MRDHMLFGETQCGEPMFTSTAGARTGRDTPCQGLFGTKLLPNAGKAAKPGISPDELLQGSS